MRTAFWGSDSARDGHCLRQSGEGPHERFEPNKSPHQFHETTLGHHTLRFGVACATCHFARLASVRRLVLEWPGPCVLAAVCRRPRWCAAGEEKPRHNLVAHAVHSFQTAQIQRRRVLGICRLLNGLLQVCASRKEDQSWIVQWIEEVKKFFTCFFFSVHCLQCCHLLSLLRGPAGIRSTTGISWQRKTNWATASAKIFFCSRNCCLCAVHQSVKELRRARSKGKQETKPKTNQKKPSKQTKKPQTPNTKKTRTPQTRQIPLQQVRHVRRVRRSPHRTGETKGL